MIDILPVFNRFQACQRPKSMFMWPHVVGIDASIPPPPHGPVGKNKILLTFISVLFISVFFHLK